MIVTATGIIVAYKQLRGIVILKRATDPDLETVAKRWFKSKNKVGFWRASFRFSTISEASRAKLFERKSRYALTEDTLCGCYAACKMVKDAKTKFKVVEIELDLTRRKVLIPKKPEQMDARKKKSSANGHGADQLNPSARRFEKREDRLSRPEPSNIGRPWQG